MLGDALVILHLYRVEQIGFQEQAGKIWSDLIHPLSSRIIFFNAAFKYALKFEKRKKLRVKKS